MLVARFFDPRRYDLAAVGRYKVNKNLTSRHVFWDKQLLKTW
ncbi:MAG: hypothetical protein ACLUAO_06195 [Streptococcus sp.]